NLTERERTLPRRGEDGEPDEAEDYGRPQDFVHDLVMASGCACHAGPPHAPPVATRDQGAPPANDACGRPLNGVEPCKEELLLRARSRVDGEKREEQHESDNPSEGMESDERAAGERGGADDDGDGRA